MDFVAPGLRHVFMTRVGRRLAVAGTTALVAAAIIREHGSPLPPAATSLISQASASVADGAYQAADAVLGPASDVLDAKVDGMARFLERRLREIRNGVDAAVVAVDRRLNPDDYSDDPLVTSSVASSSFAGSRSPAKATAKSRAWRHKNKPADVQRKAQRGDAGPRVPRA